MSTTATPDVDVVVVGGGPAGLAAALCARQRGLDVVVLEPRSGPVDKACGEGLMPGAVADLTALGVQVDGAPLRGIRYVAGTTAAEADFPGPPGAGVRRTVLHAALAARVAEVGVPVHPVSVGGVQQDDDGVRAGGVRARYLLAADGLHSGVRRQLDDVATGRQVRSRRAPRYGLRRHVAMAPWTERVEVHWAARSEAYVTPVAPDLVGVAVLTGERGSFEDQLAAFPALRDRLDGPWASSVRGAGPLHRPVRSRVHGRVLLVGDAAGYVDAVTGEGVAIAVRSARAAVAAVTADEPTRYEREWRSLSRRYRWLTEALLAAGRNPHSRRALVPAAARLPQVFGTVVAQLTR